VPGTDVGTAKTLIQRINRQRTNRKVAEVVAAPGPSQPRGGYKESGIGREFSLEGMLESYTQRKNVTVNLTH
jgi:acyl-CoA reductase-like NAD-dependent aldehyde dehydrogenase